MKYTLTYWAPNALTAAYTSSQILLPPVKKPLHVITWLLGLIYRDYAVYVILTNCTHSEAHFKIPVLFKDQSKTDGWLRSRMQFVYIYKLWFITSQTNPYVSPHTLDVGKNPRKNHSQPYYHVILTTAVSKCVIMIRLAIVVYARYWSDYTWPHVLHASLHQLLTS